MKTIIGKSKAIDRPITGIVTSKSRLPWSRNNYILVSGKAKSCPFGYTATISLEDPSNDMGKRFVTVNDINEFTDGDVITIYPHGRIIFNYEISSDHNALFATGRCNHRCIMCPQPPITKEESLTPFNLHLISLFDKSTKEIGITGGEPTLIGDDLFLLINAINSKLPNSGVSLLTNGVRFADESYARKLANCTHPNLQIDVPIFSDIAEEHDRIVGANTFYKTVEGLYNLALYKQQIGIRIVIHKLTYKRLPQLAEYIYHNFPFVCQVAFMQMETIGYAEDNIAKLWIDPADYNDELSKAIELLDMRGMNPYIYNAQLCVLPVHLRKYAVQSISDWKDIYLEQCESCSLKGKCGGFFSANRKYISKKISPVINTDGIKSI